VSKGDIVLELITIPVLFLDGSKGTARAEGNNASWFCPCGTELPLIGRCYFQFGHDCHTICPDCGRKYRVLPDKKKRAFKVKEFQ
jgi:hypothetical protein